MVEKGTVRTDGFEMDYAVFGEGERAFVILPGISLLPVTNAAEAVAQAYAAFGERYRVYLFDRKRNIEEGYFVEDMARDTARAMQMLGIRDADLFGTSQGAMMVQRIVAEHPELVRKAILASPAARPNPIIEEVFTRWRETAKTGDARALNHDFYTTAFCAETLAAVDLPALENQGTAADCARFAILAEAVRVFDGWDELSEISCPVLVLASSDDRVFGGEASREIAEKLDCACYCYEGYGHAVYDEAPDFKDRMLAFLSQREEN